METFQRFLRYVAFPTTSDENSYTTPSTAWQLDLSRCLVEELLQLGLSDARLDEYGYVYASLPATDGVQAPAVGFLAHIDTSAACSDENVKARIVPYSGGDIVLDAARNIVMRESENPVLKDFIGQHLIVTDGTTLLGSDDKAGIAAILSAVERIQTEKIPHGAVKIAFTPDEEIGRGVDHFDLSAFDADYAYTVDGGISGELEYECFNGADAKIVLHGISTHPGDAKGKMKNAALFAAELISLLPTDEVPEKTENYEGFYHLTELRGNVEEAFVHYIIRDHDRTKFEARKGVVEAAVDTINRRHGEGTAVLSLSDTYYNMRDFLEAHMDVVEAAKTAMRDLGIKPLVHPIRGGTDGAQLCARGIPCPNLCTGGANMHSRFEFNSIEALNKVRDILVKLIANAAG